jgi:C-terminal processing protease CtpA/Prc
VFLRNIACGAATNFLLSVVFILQSHPCLTQELAPKPSDWPRILAFEEPSANETPAGWGGGPPGTIFPDTQVVHGGHGAARIERRATSSGNFSTITTSLPMDFSGGTVELRGFLRTEDVSDFAGLWMREDGESPGLAFDNMQTRQLRGTTGWTEYTIKLPLVADAKRLFWGALLSGTGKVWADDLQLLVDGKPVWEAPRVRRRENSIDRDHQFDSGSGILLKGDLTPVKIDNLAILGRVWGFLKYHHPKVMAGEIHWDYELFRILPAILSAQEHATANAALASWIEGLGPVAPCNPCVRSGENDLYYRPDLDWISNRALLGEDLSGKLQAIYLNRGSTHQFYLSKVPGIGNPKFEHELGYESFKFPDSGLQLLALYRFWNIVEYWSPYRDLIGEDWLHVLNEFVPRIALASSKDNYTREMMALVSRFHDGHANLWASLNLRPPVGKCVLPVTVRFAEGQPVVSGVLEGRSTDAGALRLGDILTDLDGMPLARLIEEWKPYYAASNDGARRRDMANSMTRGDCGAVTIGVQRDRHSLKLNVHRVPPPASFSSGFTHDLPGPAFRLLSKDVAYLKLSTVKAADAGQYIEQAAGTKGLIIDIRNYPSEFVVFALGSLLVDKETEFARFTESDLNNPGAFHWTQPISLTPGKPHYSGKVVILVDEVSMSQSEYTTMAFRSAPGAVVVGSTTAGADGNVSPFALPGGLQTMISGIGVFYPDKTPTQRIGIVSNVEVKPTVADIRSGRDPVLEEALRQIRGRQVSAADIEKMSRPHE